MLPLPKICLLFLSLLIFQIKPTLGYIEHQCVQFHRPLYNYHRNTKEPIHGFTIVTQPSTLAFNIVIYRDEDRIQTNIPQRAYDEDGNLNEFFDNYCTEENKDKKNCEPGTFIINFHSDNMKERVINLRIAHLDHYKLDVLDYSKYCYYIAYSGDVPKETILESNNNQEPFYLSANQPLGYYLLSEFSSYFAYRILVISELCLIVIIWYFRLRKITLKESQDIKFPNPLQYFMNILICSVIMNSFHSWNAWNVLDFKYLDDSFFARFLKLYSIEIVLKVIQEVLIYLMVYRFVTLQKPSLNLKDHFRLKINDVSNTFRESKLKKLFLFMLIWSTIIFPIAIYFDGYILFNSYTEEYRETIAKNYLVIRGFFQFLNFVDFALVWFILYKISQETEESLNLKKEAPQYGRTFKHIRVFIAFSALVLNVSGCIIEAYVSPAFYDISEWAVNYLDDSTNALSFLFKTFATIFFRLLFAFIQHFRNFGSLALIIVALYIYWDPESYSDHRITLTSSNSSDSIVDLETKEKP